MRSPIWARSTSRCIEDVSTGWRWCRAGGWLGAWRGNRGGVGFGDALLEERAQATVEAAFLLPTFLTLLLLSLQPVCLLYTRAVMESAAAETARLMITAEDELDAYEAFALRRLAAVPDLSIFHEGGSSAWDIDLSLASENDGMVAVEIEGTVSPLPVLGVFVRAFGSTDENGDVVLTVAVTYEGRPDWLEGDYDTWIEVWE